MIKVNDRVIRLDGGYTAGRKGIVIEMDHGNSRAKVSWTQDSKGNKMTLRTWIKLTSIKKLN